MKSKIGFLFILPLAACTHLSLDARREVAEGIAQAAHMTAQIIPAGNFNLTAYERFTQAGAPMRVYIEGDGLAWVTRRDKSMNPTPPDPIGLRLAAADAGANVVYLARPCQYSGMRDGSSCPDMYWTNARTAPEVIAAYEQTLDALKAEHGAAGFELVGYSGGAAVAVLAAAARTDVVSIRTVAGNTDYAAFDSVHRLDAAEGSLRPEDVALKLAHVPQLHFVGGEDKVVTGDVFGAWMRASGASGCVRARVVDGNTHDRGWAETWAELLKVAPVCE